MEPEVHINHPGTKKRKILLIALLAFIAAMLITATVFSYLALQYEYAYAGVNIEGIDVSGMSKPDIQQTLEIKYAAAADTIITLKSHLAELDTSYEELGVVYDITAATEEAYSIGRSGNVFERLYDIARAGISGIFVSVPQSFDDKSVSDFVERFADSAIREVKEGTLLIADDYVTLTSGRHGESFDKAAAKSLVINMISNNEGGAAEPEITMTYPADFNADDLYAQILSEPKNASYIFEDGAVRIASHSAGRHIDKAFLTQIVNEHNLTEEKERELPVTFTKPELTTFSAAAMLFRDEIANYSSSFKTRTQNEKNRAYNIALTIDKCNNHILMPGQEFSFNEVVGPRNKNYGYKEAHIYINGKIEDGVGGGICQTVSTLYNAVLMSDLEVLERKSHSFIVTYVPLGQDATAYYGATDFRFVNNTGWPIKILAWIEDNRVNVVFKGTNANPEKSVIISNKTLSRTPRSINYKDDPKLPVGTTKTEMIGTDGFVVETYKTIKSGKNVVSQIKLHTSRYKPCNDEVRVGILQPDGTTTPGLAAQMKKQLDTPAVPESPGTPGTSSDQKDTSGTPGVPEKPTSPEEPGSDQTPDVPADTDPTGASETTESEGPADHTNNTDETDSPDENDTSSGESYEVIEY